MSDLPIVRASDADRERSVVRLREAAADGRLTLDEFTERMNAVYAARTHDELETLLHDLPERVAEPLPVKPRRAVSVLGNTVLDLAGTPAGEVAVQVVCVMGNATVIVPRTAHVELDAVAIMGNKHIHGRREQGDGPRVRVAGLVVMGNLVVRRR
jgi:DUF1707 SHOCT-like domain